MNSPDRIAVIAAVGEVIDRPSTLAEALDPVGLMAAALLDADAEAGGRLLGRVDSLDVVNLISWPYAFPPDELCARLNIEPARRNYGPVGGETPIAFIQAAAERIRAGKSAVAVICGGEAHHSAARVEKSATAPNWPPKSALAPLSVRSQDIAQPVAKRFGVDIPVTVYPLFENAQNHLWSLSPGQALTETAELWSAFSNMAANNEHAAIRRVHRPAEIAQAGPDNRMLAWPYSKLMVANISVNQGAAIIVTSLAVARECGLDDGRLLFVEYGNCAQEPQDYLARDSFCVNHARDCVLEDVRDRFQDGFDAVELYSCFPCVPKAARRTLGLADGTALSQAGGLTFFGAPLNNYMSHAAAAMARALRERSGRGLLYGQGGVATKHRSLVVNTRPPASSELSRSVQAKADARRRDVPSLADDAQGSATVETFTVIHDRHGGRKGVVVARTTDGARCVAGVVPDEALIDRLESLDASPIGLAGKLRCSADGRNQWSL